MVYLLMESKQFITIVYYPYAGCTAYAMLVKNYLDFQDQCDLSLPDRQVAAPRRIFHNVWQWLKLVSFDVDNLLRIGDASWLAAQAYCILCPVVYDMLDHAHRTLKHST